MDYSTPKYANSWLPIFYFKDFGDYENYFIQLEYVVNKINYAPVLHKSLDLDIVAANGQKIFSDLDSTKRALLASRNYVLLTSTETPTSNHNDRFWVTELYGYAPQNGNAPKSYTTYSDAVVSAPSLLYPDGLGIDHMPAVNNAQYYYYQHSENSEVVNILEDHFRQNANTDDDENYYNYPEEEELSAEEIERRSTGSSPDVLTDADIVSEEAFNAATEEVEAADESSPTYSLAQCTARIAGGSVSKVSNILEFEIDNVELAKRMEVGAYISLQGIGRQVLLLWWFGWQSGLIDIKGKKEVFYTENGKTKRRFKFYIDGRTSVRNTNGNSPGLGDMFSPDRGWWGLSIYLTFYGNVRFPMNVAARTKTVQKFYTTPPPASEFKHPDVFNKLGAGATYGNFLGLNFVDMHSMTTPTAAEWLSHSQNGDFYVLDGTKMDYRDGLYVLSTTYAPYV